MGNINIGLQSAKGNRARTAKLSPEERSTIAKLAARARWAKDMVKKTHKCNDYCECNVCGKPRFMCASKNLHPFSCKKLL